MKDMLYLYFIKDDKQVLYGSGNKNYIRELINDYVYIHEMYEKDEVTFKISKKLIKE
jgi:hypothetical protein